MARSKSDISNTAIRIFLQQVGRFYDQIRGLPEYRSTPAQKQEILAFFDNGCCYCGASLLITSLSEDHLAPMNKKALGLHAWGNIVPACANCNAKKHNKTYEMHLRNMSGTDIALADARAQKIREFLAHYRYDPNLQLHEIATNLYQDVGAVSMTLIDLRFKQAEDMIRQIHNSEPTPNHALQQTGSAVTAPASTPSPSPTPPRRSRASSADR